jgi:hypothetical protein
VFAYQAEGEKLWHVYEARADNPINPVPPGDEAEKWLVDTRGKLLHELVMRPGDLLYLPRGQYHDAITGDGASLHVTYWVKPATGLSLFKLLETALAGEGFPRHCPTPTMPPRCGSAWRAVARGGLLLPVVRSTCATCSAAWPPRRRVRAAAAAAAAVLRDRDARPVLRRAGTSSRSSASRIPVGNAYPAVWLLGRGLPFRTVRSIRCGRGEAVVLGGWSAARCPDRDSQASPAPHPHHSGTSSRADSARAALRPDGLYLDLRHRAGQLQDPSCATVERAPPPHRR